MRENPVSATWRVTSPAHFVRWAALHKEPCFVGLPSQSGRVLSRIHRQIASLGWFILLLRSSYTMRTKCAISDAFVRDCVFAYCASVAQYVYSLPAEHCFRLRNNAISDERVRDCALSTHSVFRPLLCRLPASRYGDTRSIEYRDGSPGVECWTSSPEVQGSNPWGTGPLPGWTGLAVDTSVFWDVGMVSIVCADKHIRCEMLLKMIIYAKVCFYAFIKYVSYAFLVSFWFKI